MRRAEELGTGFAVGLAAMAAVGARWSLAVPWWIVAATLAWAAWRRHPVVVVAAVFLLAGWLGARAWSGLVAPPAGPFEASVTLTTDPEASFGGVRVEARGEGQRFELWVRGPAIRHVRDRLAGQRLVVTGRVEPLPDGSWLRSRHIVARVLVDDVRAWDEGTPLAQAANHVRRLLTRAAEALPASHRPLFTGMVVGDDRGQDPAVADDFRAAGLTHLLAVSGQNVAFVLALVAPLLTRLGLRSRLVLVLGVLGFFALVTRFEPSVLRATAMAALAAVAATVGRPVPGVRVLAMAVTGLVLLDPFLVRSIGFQLSVAASCGILVLSRPIAEALPGPQVLRTALAVTIAAQLGVAPVLIPVFGGLPVASVPANVLVGPVAGFVTMWGLTAGLVAGVAGGPLAGLLLAPVDLALDWIATVARVVSGWPLGELDLTAALVVAGAAAVVVWARRRPGERRARVAAGIAVAIIAVTVCLPGVRLLGAPPVRVELAETGTVWRHSTAAGSTAVLVLDATAHTSGALESVRRAGIDHLDLLVVPSGGSRTAELVHQLGRRVSVAQVWAPAGHRVAGASTPALGSVTTAGGVRLDVIEQRPVLRVDVSV